MARDVNGSRIRTLRFVLLTVAALLMLSQLFPSSRRNLASESEANVLAGSSPVSRQSRCLSCRVLKATAPRELSKTAIEDPDHPSRRRFFDAITISESAPQRAAAMLRESIAEDPHFESAQERLALVLQASGQSDAARDAAERCLTLNPRNPICRHLLIEETRGDGPEGLEQSARIAKECVDASPHDWFCVETLRKEYLRNGRVDEAQHVLENWLRPDLSDGERALSLSDYFHRAGDLGASKKYLDEACRIGTPGACPPEDQEQ